MSEPAGAAMPRRKPSFTGVALVDAGFVDNHLLVTSGNAWPQQTDATLPAEQPGLLPGATQPAVYSGPATFEGGPVPQTKAQRGQGGAKAQKKSRALVGQDVSLAMGPQGNARARIRDRQLLSESAAAEVPHEDGINGDHSSTATVEVRPGGQQPWFALRPLQGVMCPLPPRM